MHDLSFLTAKLVAQSHSQVEYACSFHTDVPLPSPLADTFDVAPFHRCHHPAPTRDLTSKALFRA